MTGTDLQAEIEKAIQLLEEDIAAAVAEERAAVVAWLRARGVEIENWPPGGRNEISLTYNIIADAIENGEHRREEER